MKKPSTFDKVLVVLFLVMIMAVTIGTIIGLYVIVMEEIFHRPSFLCPKCENSLSFACARVKGIAYPDAEIKGKNGCYRECFWNCTNYWLEQELTYID